MGVCSALVLGVLMVAGGGCQRDYRAFARELDGMVASGAYVSARDLAVSEAEKNAGDQINRVVYNLEAARAAQIAGDFDASLEYFARVHEDVRPYLDQQAEAKVTEALATTAVNQTTATFRGTPVDRIMATALNSVNFLAVGDPDGARVQLNLTRDWQEDAVARYSAKVEKAGGAAGDAAVDDGRVGGILGEHYAGLGDLRGYSDYKNPFASHLRGVFLLSAGSGAADLDRARFELREVVGMEPEAASMVTPDLEAIDGGGSGAATTWVYVMAGRGPWLEQLRVDVPIPVGNVNYVAAAFPQIRFHDQAVGRVEVQAAGVSVEAVRLADVDAMVGAEFKDRLPRIIAQEILSAGLKAAVTFGARDRGGSLAQLAGIIYQAATASADTRSWRTLPKRVLLARVPTPGDGVVLVDAGGVRSSVVVEPGESHVVLLTMPSGSVSPSVVRASFRPKPREEIADGS